MLDQYIVQRSSWAIALFLSLVGMGLSPAALAKDPFRTASPRAIGDETEQAFHTLFTQGNYREARPQLAVALAMEAPDPMVPSMLAAIAYLDGDWENFRRYGTQTRQVGEQLISTDPLRGNLYTAVGHFFEGGAILQREGTVRGIPGALAKLQEVYRYLGRAEQRDPKDPELNLLRGYMDLMLALALPLAKPDQAIERLQTYGAPPFLVQRGLALAYRDLGEGGKASKAIDQALHLAPGNPDLLYLKAQILVRQQQDREAVVWFEKALAQTDQWIPTLVRQVRYEHCRAINRVDQGTRSCRSFLKGEPQVP